jgi:5'-nucleotidase
VTSRPEPAKWSTAENHACDIIKKIQAAGIPHKVLMNVNFPNVISEKVKGVRITCLGNRKILDNLVSCVDPRGKPYYWIGSAEERYEDCAIPKAGSDLEAIMDGYISVTPLCLDLTHSPTFNVLQGVFNP